MIGPNSTLEALLKEGIAGLWAALPAELRAGWPVPPVFGENVTVRPPNPPSPYVRLDFPGSSFRQETIGDPGGNEWRDTGAFMVHVFVPVGTGAELLRALGDTIATLYLDAAIDGLSCYECLPGQSGPRGDGNWWGRSFGVSYTWQTAR